MRTRAARPFVWLGVLTLLVLVARSLAYALSTPTDLSGRLEGSAGGPRLVVVTLTSLGLAVALSGAVVWIAALGVRERCRLRPERRSPRLQLRRLALRGLALWAGSSLAFALLESYLHWRAGIGFHGLFCLLGPVHRNVVPLLAALALVAASLAEAAQHLLAWMRATVRELLRSRLAATRPLVFAPSPRVIPALARLAQRPRPRAPPLPA